LTKNTNNIESNDETMTPTPQKNLAELCEVLKRELGASGETLRAVIESATRLLGESEVQGEDLVTQAKWCLQASGIVHQVTKKQRKTEPHATTETEPRATTKTEPRATTKTEPHATTKTPSPWRDVYSGSIAMDVGTSYSHVAVWQNDGVVVCTNQDGDRATPSVVAFSDEGRVVGEAALSYASSNASNTVFNVTGLIGRRFSSDDLPRGAVRMTAANDGGPLLHVVECGEAKALTPVEVMALIVQDQKKVAEAFLKKRVDSVVLAVPGRWNFWQRRAMRDAAELAGLSVVRFVAQATVAGYAYALREEEQKQRGDEEPTRLLVFDLGGGALEVSLLDVDEGIVEIRATASDTRVGGEAFTRRVVEYFAQKFQHTHLSGNALRRVTAACERAKRLLSEAAETRVDVDDLFADGTGLHETLTRAQFETVNQDLFARCVRCVDRALRDADCPKDRVHEILFVGGSTRIPQVRTNLSSFFDHHDDKLRKTTNRDEAAVNGAAVQAAAVSGFLSGKISDSFILDETTWSLGVETAGARMTALVPKNSTIPTKKSARVTTVVDNQPGVWLSVYEGEDPSVNRNTLLSRVYFGGIEPAAAGVPRLDLTLDVDATDEVILLTVEDASTKKTLKARVGIPSRTDEAPPADWTASLELVLAPTMT